MDNFIRGDLEQALLTISSMISRSEKVQNKFKEGTPQASLARNRIKALYIASSLVAKELEGDHSTVSFNKEDLEKALPPITSTISKCEKAQEKLKEGTPQLTLTRKMIQALYISLSLITKELNK
ncbi:hypothetical protein [Lutispora sp.]|uniref:hypothetical protein n=1 Tax=Lutispora sp. TaxID=2828727 RepID=UPI0035655891